MDCFKAATTRSAATGDGKGGGGRVPSGKSRKPATPKRPSGGEQHRTRPAPQRSQFELPYDPIDLDGGDSASEAEADVDAAAAATGHSARQRDWWETLFPAKFTLDSSDASLEDVGCDDRAAAGGSGGGNAYRRVWERLQREEAEAAAAAAAASFDDGVSESPPPPLASSLGHRKRSPRGEASGGGGECLWTPGELRLFREELDKLKQENNLLKAAVRFQAERLHCLETKCRAQSRQLLSKSGAASEAARANERYRILVDSLQSRALEAERCCGELRSGLALTVEERDRAREEAGTAGERLQRAGAKLGRLRERESALREELARDFALREEQLRVEQAGQMRCLEDSLADLRSELRKEQYLHCATRLGHQKLLTHFSSAGGSVCSTCGGGRAASSGADDADVRLF